MKKIKQLSLFFALAFSFLGMKVDAQVNTYEPASGWGPLEVSATVGQLTKRMFYDFQNPVIRRIYKNGAPQFIPNYVDYWEIVSETTLSGSGIDVVSLNLPQSPNGSWAFKVHLLNSNYQDVIPHVLLFPHGQPLNPLQISYPDPQYGFDGSLAGRSIYYNPSINSIFNPSDGENYTNIFYARLYNSNGYDVTVSQAYQSFSAAQGFTPHFDLPFDITGTWCFEAWVNVTHNSITPSYWTGEKLQWPLTNNPYPLCWVWDFSTSVDEETSSDFRAFPNPFTDVITIDSPSVTEYSLLNISGQVVASGILSVGENRLTDLSELEPGAYIMQTDLGSTRIIKQ